MASTKQTQNGKSAMNPVAEAEAIIRDLEGQRAALLKRRSEHDAERQRIAFAARAQGDQAASKRLSEMTTEAIRFDHELRDVESAMTTAQARLQHAQQAEAQAANRQWAAEAQTLVRELADVFPYVDKHLAAALNGLIAIERGVAELHQKGVAFPTDIQLRQGITQVIETWAQQLPRHWHNKLSDGLKYLPPHERKTAVQYYKAIEASLQNAIAQAPVTKAPAMQRSDAADRREAVQAAREFLGPGGA
jgi:hypothetical protein